MTHLPKLAESTLNEEPHNPVHDTTISALRVIEVALRKTRAHAIRPRALQILIWSACAIGAVLLSALLLAALFPDHARHITSAMLMLGLGGVLVTAAAALYATIWRGPDEFDIARIIQHQ